MAALLVLITAILTSCGGMRPSQLQQIGLWEKEAIELGHPEVRFVEHKDPATAAALGFVLGAGGFYVQRPGLGVTGLLFWPLSIAWVPPAAYASAHQYNFGELRAQILALRESAAPKSHWNDPNAALLRLEELRTQGRITESEYDQARQKLHEASEPKPAEAP